MLDYVRDAAEIYRQSFATIRAEADLSRFPDDVARVVVRLIHTCGQVDLAEHVAFTPGVVGACHAGWKGALTGVVESTVAATAMVERDGDERCERGEYLRSASLRPLTKQLLDHQEEGNCVHNQVSH